MANKAIMPFEDYQAACDAIREKTGGTALIKSGEMAGLIEGIVGGGPAENLDAEVAAQVTLLNTQEEKIAELAEILAGKAAGEGGEPKLQDKTVTPTESKQTITADSNYDGLDTVTVNAIPNTYVQPTSTKAATTYTPTTTNQTIAAGTYCSGVQTIKGDANLVAGNIKSGTSIFGVSGTYVGTGGSGGGNGEEEVASLLGNTMTVLSNSIVTSLRTRACQGATKLTTVNLPMVTSLGSYAFYQCSGLVTVKLPKLTSVSTQTFYSCTKLKHADCGQLGNIPAQTFNACSALTELILRKTSSVCTLSNVNGVNNTPIGQGTGYVYVPAALIESYKTATNWVTFANQFRALENYTVDGTITGELDENKISG